MAGTPASALFLSGSHGRGDADAWSDYDFLALGAAKDHDAIGQVWRDALNHRFDIVHWMGGQGRATLINAVTSDWARIDLLLITSDALAGRAQNMIRPLFDHDDVYGGLPSALPPRTPNAKRVDYIIREFIRVLGLLPVGVGREEWTLLIQGVGLLRGHLTDLMKEASTEPDPGGMLHPSRILPPEDIALLERLPNPPAERDALITANLAYAEAFLPRAKAMAKDLGLDWPEAFEAATRAHLKTTLGLTLPPTE